MKDLLEIELWPEFASSHHGVLEIPDKNDFFACRSCLKVRSAIEFRNPYMTGYYGKYGKDLLRGRVARYYIECEIRSKIYHGEERYDFGGASGGYATIC